MNRLLLLAALPFLAAVAAARAQALATGDPALPAGEMRTLQSFAAVGDGVADDTAAVAAAFASGKPLSCIGRYKLTSTVTYEVPPGGGIALTGFGRQSCRFIWSPGARGSTAFLFKLPKPDLYSTPEIVLRDFSLVPAIASTGTGIAIVGPSGAGSGSTDPELDIEGVDIKPAAAADHFKVNLALTNVRNPIVRGMTIEGRRDAGGYADHSVGIAFNGDAQPVDAVFEDNHLYLVETAFALTGTWQGVTIAHNTVVAARFGVMATASDNNGNGLYVHHNPFNVADRGVEAVNIAHPQIEGNYTILADVGPGSPQTVCYRLAMTSAVTMSGDVTHNACDGFARKAATQRIGVSLDGVATGTLNAFVGFNSYTNLDIGTDIGRNVRGSTFESGGAQCSGVAACTSNAAVAGANAQIAPNPF